MDLEGVQGIAAAGIVLAGGRSSRMGRPKAGLDWHGTTLLYRTVAILSRAVDGPVLVVRAPGQVLPELPPGVGTVDDPVADLGPMQGLAAGLAALAGRTDRHGGVAFACSTDLPFLHPAFVTRVLTLLADHGPGGCGADSVMPVVGGHRQPLAAAYRVALAPLLAELLAGGDARPTMLPRHCRVVLPDEAELLAGPDLRRLDPELASVRGVDTPEQYARARALPPPTVRITPPAGVTRVAPAATLRAAAEVVGLRMGSAGSAGPAVTINDRPTPCDPRQPLVTGDHVRFRPGTRPPDPGNPSGRSRDTGRRVGWGAGIRRGGSRAR